MRHRQKLREKIPEIIIEISSIILAVLLALAVNEWRETRKTETLVDHASERITGELWRNRKVIEANLPGHRNITETLQTRSEQSVSAESEAQREEAQLQDIHFYPVFLRSSAWQAAMAAGAIGAMPYDKVSSLSEIYTYQEAFLDAQKTIMEASINQSFSGHSDPTSEHLQAIARTLGILVLMEEQLLAIYEVYLEGDQTYESLIRALSNGTE